MKKIICFILSLVMILSAIPVVTFADETIPEPVSADEDTYISSYIETPDAKKEQVLLTGSVYERYALIKFDISSFAQKTFQGSILALTLRNVEESSRLTLYSYDESAEDILSSLKFVTTSTLEKAGKSRMEFVVSDYIDELLADGKTTACFALKSDARVLSIFSSEYSNKTERPSLYCTEGPAYVEGQVDYAYPDVSPERIRAELSKAVAKGHPRLMADKEDFDRARQLIADGDPIICEQYSEIRARAEAFINEDIHYLPAPEITYVSIGVETRKDIFDCCFMYQITGDERYADRAIKEVMYYAGLESWGTYQMIDNNQVATSVAIVYDWLYDYLNQSERDTLVGALKRLHLDALHDMFTNPQKADYQITLYLFYYATSNHGVVDNTCTFNQALAIAETDPDYSAFIMSNCLKNLQGVFDGLYPDAGYDEGIGYWDNLGPYMARMFATMDCSFDSYLGFENISTVVNMCDFSLYAQSSVNSTVYCDGWQIKELSHEKYYLAKMINDRALMTYSVRNDDIAWPLFCLWYDPTIEYSAELDLTLDKHFRKLELGVMRDTFEGNQENYGNMITNGPLNVGAYTNQGTIALHALGEEWICAPGRDSYSLDQYSHRQANSKRWKYYFARSEGNNCVVINPSSLPGQELDVDCKIDTFVSEERGAYAVSDLTPVYRQQVKSYQRAYGLLDDRTQFVLQDEITMLEPSEMYSFINFRNAEFEITEDNDVIVSKGNKKIFANIISDQPYEVSIMRSVPLPTSDLAPGERRINDIKKIAIHYDNVDKVNLRVEMTPVFFEEEIEYRNKQNEIIPIAEWQIEEGERSIPMLKTLTFDGKTPENFSPYNRAYIIEEGKPLPANVEATVDESKYSVSVTKDNEAQVWKIIVNDKNDPDRFTTYCVGYPPAPPEPLVIDTATLDELKVKSVRASHDDGNVPSNTIDGDLNTRWSASGEATITFELDKAVNVNCISIAYMDGDKRRSYFDVELSEDGKNWKTLTDFSSSGVTLEPEFFELKDIKAKYVRLHCFGNSQNGWNSLTDVKIYKK